MAKYTPGAEVAWALMRLAVLTGVAFPRGGRQASLHFVKSIFIMGLFLHEFIEYVHDSCTLEVYVSEGYFCYFLLL